MQRKRLSIGAGALAALYIAVAGCERTIPPPAPPPFHGAVVKVACPPALAELLRAQSRAWQARQQAAVEHVGESDRADVRIVHPQALAGPAAAGKLAVLPAAWQERGNPFDWAAQLPAYREQLLLWDGKAFAVPLVGESPVCLYRADLFAEARHQQGYKEAQAKAHAPGHDLRAPLTWDEFARIAEYFQRHAPGGKPAPSLPPLPEGAAELDRLFCTVAASCARRAVRLDELAGREHLDEVFSFHCDQKTGAPRIAGPGFVAALRLLQRLQACRPAGTHPRPIEAFRDGRAVLCIADASALHAIQQVPALRDKVGVCPVPGSARYFTSAGQERPARDGVNRVPYLGGAGWLAAVPADAASPEAAFDLLADLAGPARSMQITLEPASTGPTRTDQVLRERWDAFDLDAERTRALREAVSRTVLEHGLKNPVLCLRTPDALALRDDLVEQVRAALLHGEDAAAALQAAARRWNQRIAARGKDVHLRDYRISLGLLGR
jgi:ABC-type glycerol-3-phosphate transport system substrate-binding protein